MCSLCPLASSENTWTLSHIWIPIALAHGLGGSPCEFSSNIASEGLTINELNKVNSRAISIFWYLHCGMTTATPITFTLFFASASQFNISVSKRFTLNLTHHVVDRNGGILCCRLCCEGNALGGACESRNYSYCCSQIEALNLHFSLMSRKISFLLYN